MTAVPRPLSRITILGFAVFTLCAISFLFRDRNAQARINGTGIPFPISVTDLKHTSGDKNALQKIRSRLDLTEVECKYAFPNLTKDVDDNVKRGKFVFKRSNPDYQGLVQGRILDGKLYVLTAAPDHTADILHQRTAILSQIHRAILTSPAALPDTHFAFVINDSPKNNSWVFARPNKETGDNMWLMPHFGFWAWPGKTLGTLDDVLSRIENVENRTPWERKTDKAVWRGTAWFNPVGRPTLRKDLIKTAKGKDWADIEALNVSTQGQYTNALRIEDFCKYKYIVYTEGVTYSGRLPYHQTCASVLLTPPLSYLTQTAHLLRPIMAEDLVAAVEGKGLPKDSSSGSYFRPLLATVTDWRLANTIYLDPTFSNLESTVLFLRSHPKVAQTLAKNQRDTVIGRGYLSPAAETCYWRALVRGWASVAVVDEEWGDDVGERFEGWILKQVEGRSARVLGKVGGANQ